MALTDDNVTDLIRSFLAESTAVFWTDAEIVLYKTMGMDKVLARWYVWLYKLNKKHEDFAIVSGTAAYDLPDDCYKVGLLEIKESGEKAEYIEDDAYHRYANVDTGDAVWMYTGGQIEIVPTPATTDTDYYQIWYMPILDAVTEFPECLRPLIAIEAVKLAKLKDNALEPSIMAIEKDYIKAAQFFFAISQFDSPDTQEEYLD